MSLATASTLGADAVATSADVFEREHGWETVIDCTGAVPAIEVGLRRVDRGGTFELFGVAAGDAPARISPFDVYRSDVTFYASA